MNKKKIVLDVHGYSLSEAQKIIIKIAAELYRSGCFYSFEVNHGCNNGDKILQWLRLKCKCKYIKATYPIPGNNNGRTRVLLG